MAKGLVQFSIANDGSDYILSIEDEDGDTTEFTVSFEQLDLIAEALDEHLNADEDSALGVDGDAVAED
jgi:hypothetical protein